MKYRIVTIFILAGLFLSSASAADYYVSSTGSDANSGISPAQAWKTLSKVNSKMSQFTSDAAANDVTIHFNNSDTWVLGTSEEFTINCRGLAAHWITFDGESWGGHPSGTSKAIITRTSASAKRILYVTYGDGTYSQDAYIVIKGFDLDGRNLVDNELVGLVNANYVKILNNKIHDTMHGDGKYTPTLFITTTGDVAGHIEIHDLEVSNNEIYGSGAHGVAFYPRTGNNNPADLDNVASIIVKQNVIYDFGNSPSSSYGSGIQVMSCVGGDISDNVIYDGYGSGDGFGIKLETRNRRCAGVDIHGNLIYGGSSIELCVGMSIDGAQNIDVFNNIIRDTSYEAISWGGSYGGASGRVLNNTICQSGTDAINLSSTSQIDELRNNIIYQTANVRAINRSDRISQHSHNNFYNTTSGRAVVGSFTTGNWVSGWEQTGKSGSPGFENVSALPTAFDSIRKISPAGLRITSTGAAYHGGTNLISVFNDDIDGTTRTSPWDIGACQFTASGGETQIPAPPSRPRVILDI
jgi:hypothetical protein